MENSYQRTKKSGKYHYKHDDVWKEYYGDIPEGMIIHHIDGNKRNNDINNLIMMTVRDHNRTHAGFKKIGEIWFKECRGCHQLKEVNSDNWYLNKKDNSVASGYCRPCFKERMRLRKAQRLKKTRCQGDEL